MGASRREARPALLCDESFAPEVALEVASPAMRAFGRVLALAAGCDVPVLLVGEVGAGKTTFARALHAMSARAVRPFVRVDCRAGAADLSAHAAAARTGTLFLDDVAELVHTAQAAALKLLEDASCPARPIDIRVVASTRNDLDEEVAAGRFRRDLFYRLAVLELRIPPLRERADDILPIARAFLASLADGARRPAPELSPDVARALVEYPWPGNVEELLTVLERAMILTPAGTLDVSALPGRVTSRPRTDPPSLEIDR
jgi:two-component system response regulator HydG